MISPEVAAAQVELERVKKSLTKQNDLLLGHEEIVVFILERSE